MVLGFQCIQMGLRGIKRIKSRHALFGPKYVYVFVLARLARVNVPIVQFNTMFGLVFTRLYAMSVNANVHANEYRSLFNRYARAVPRDLFMKLCDQQRATGNVFGEMRDGRTILQRQLS